MPDDVSRLERDRARLEAVADKGAGAKLGAYAKMSGPGWVQSALTLGGGSLGAALYLGSLGGYGLMWVQPIAMVMGVSMLMAIAYVTLSTGKRPLRLVTEEVNPVLGWGWLIASLMANIVWCLPQFTLGTAALQQNLFPGLIGEGSVMGVENGKYVAVAALAVISLLMIISYERGGRGLAIFETILKVLVAVIVACFIGVVWKLTGVEGGINWSEVWSGFIPNFSDLTSPPAAFTDVLAAAGDNASYWKDKLVGDRMFTVLAAAATAVGINMTFLLPNSLLDRGWNKTFRGFSLFDLATALFIPFLIATTCVVIASASRFHGKYNEAMVAAEPTKAAATEAGNAKLAGAYLGLLDARLADEFGKEEAAAWTNEEWAARRAALPNAERQLAAMLAKRDADALAAALEPLTGKAIAQIVFGIGVLAMATSTIIVLMLINGYCFSEMFNQPQRGKVHFMGTLLPLAFGAIAPFVWTKAMFWLAIPASVIGYTLLPIAYCTFFFLMNSERVLGEDRPRGVRRFLVNAVLLASLVLTTIGAGLSINSKAGWMGFAAAGGFIALALIFRRKAASAASPA